MIKGLEEIVKPENVTKPKNGTKPKKDSGIIDVQNLKGKHYLVTSGICIEINNGNDNDTSYNNVKGNGYTTNQEKEENYEI